jgi:hypothetical protein
MLCNLRWAVALTQIEDTDTAKMHEHVRSTCRVDLAVDQPAIFCAFVFVFVCLILFF